MFEFARYAAPTEAAKVDLVERNPFAILVCQSEGGAIEATHIPVVFPARPEELAGAHMIGHMARVNPEWKSLVSVRKALLVFSGPSGYVSPRTYQVPRMVPTWDYAAVHAEVDVDVVLDDAENLGIVRDTVERLEELTGDPWDMTESLEVFRRIIGGVVGFRFTVTSVAAVFKLSQNMPEVIWRRVHDEAARRDTANSPLAELMELTGWKEER